MNFILDIFNVVLLGTKEYATHHYQDWTMYLIAIHVAILIVIIILFIIGRQKKEDK